MSTRLYIAGLIGLMISGVLFGIGALTVLMIPAFAAKANVLLPVAIVLSFLLTPPIAWKIAPKLRARNRPKPHVP